MYDCASVVLTYQVVIKMKELLIIKDFDRFFDDSAFLKLASFGNDESD